MSDNQQSVKEEEQQQQYIKPCNKCTKVFTDQLSYKNHKKLKHKKQKKSQSQQNQQSQQQSEEYQQEKPELNDIIKKSKNIPIKSQLGQKNIQPLKNKERLNFNKIQNITGKSNYAVNQVVRTPYEEKIKCSQQITIIDFQLSQYDKFLCLLFQELVIIQSCIQSESFIWQLKDPMAPEQEFQNQFSLMDIRKLIKNYPKRQINVQHPHFCIFLLWIARICKVQAIKQFYIILGQYLAKFEIKNPTLPNNEEIYQIWKNFYKIYQTEKINEQYLKRFNIFDQKTIRKFVEYFVTWVDLFKALII